MFINIVAPLLRAKELHNLADMLAESVQLATQADVGLSPQYLLTCLAIVNNESLLRVLPKKKGHVGSVIN